nr:MAG TPA: hypothetical protein [Caudoviricetes sp.]
MVEGIFSYFLCACLALGGEGCTCDVFANRNPRVMEVVFNLFLQPLRN